jgi:hypothetical protein
VVLGDTLVTAVEVVTEVRVLPKLVKLPCQEVEAQAVDLRDPKLH